MSLTMTKVNMGRCGVVSLTMLAATPHGQHRTWRGYALTPGTAAVTPWSAAKMSRVAWSMRGFSVCCSAQSLLRGVCQCIGMWRDPLKCDSIGKLRVSGVGGMRQLQAGKALLLTVRGNSSRRDGDEYSNVNSASAPDCPGFKQPQ
jgi:hypothetical protein